MDGLTGLTKLRDLDFDVALSLVGAVGVESRVGGLIHPTSLGSAQCVIQLTAQAPSRTSYQPLTDPTEVASALL